jgi:hypothetical protein
MENILVGRKKIEWIANTYAISAHAKTRIIRRDKYSSFDLRERILRSPLAWKTSDTCIAIALDLHNYIIVDTASVIDGETRPLVVTFVNTEQYEENVIDKMLVAYKEFCFSH